VHSPLGAIVLSTCLRVTASGQEAIEPYNFETGTAATRDIFSGQRAERKLSWIRGSGSAPSGPGEPLSGNHSDGVAAGLAFAAPAVRVTAATVAITGFGLDLPFSWETSTVSCRQRYFQFVFEQISIETPETRSAFSGQRSPRVCALQAGFAGSAPGAQPETARSIGIAIRTPAVILPGPLGLRITPNRYATAARAQSQVLRYYQAWRVEACPATASQAVWQTINRAPHHCLP